MTAADMMEIYRDYAEWQSKTAHTKSGPMVKSIMQAIGYAKKDIIEDMNATVNHFYMSGKFKSKAEAMAYLNQPIDPETAELLKQSAQKIKNKKKRERELWRLQNGQAFRARLTNRGALSYITQNTIADVFDRIHGTITEGLYTTVKETAARSMFTIQKGIRAGWSFQMPNKRQIAALIKHIYVPEYAQSIARGHATVTKDIIIGGVASGTPVDRIAHQITAESMAELWQAKRLVRTEITKAGNIAEAYAMDSAGVEQYEFSCTLDERTCPICGSQDGKIYDLKEGKEGVNYPPMHPNCRCWTHPALNKDIQKKLTRAHRDPKTGQTSYVPMSMKYNEWAEKYLGYVPEEAPAEEIKAPPVLNIEHERATEYKAGVFEGTGIKPEFIATMKDRALRSAEPEALDVWNHYNDKVRIIDAKHRGKSAYYDPIDRGIKFNINSEMKPQTSPRKFRNYPEGTVQSPEFDTIYHELGHNIDHSACIEILGHDTDRLFSSTYKSHEFLKSNGEGYTLEEMVRDEIREKTDPIQKAIKERTKGIKKDTFEGMQEVWRIEREEKDKLYNAYFDDKPLQYLGGISDMTQGATDGEIRYYMGHGRNYWKFSYLGSEAFAEMYSASMRGDEEVNIIKRYIPKSFKLFKELLSAIKRGVM